MIAVFESKTPYFQINKGQVMNTKPSYSDEAVYYSDSGTPDRHTREQVGTTFTETTDSFLFAGGKDHNILELTDPEEVEAFRAFIENRDDIREIGSLSV